MPNGDPEFEKAPDCAIANTALDFMEGAYQAFQNVRIEMGFDVFDYHEKHHSEEIERMQNNCGCE